MEETCNNRITEVYNVFKDFFGEDYVDLRSSEIMVYFPEIKITNEHDRYVIIEDLYVRIPLSPDGNIISGFQINRGKYTYAQFNYHYMHSHAPSLILKTNESPCSIPFMTPCLGSGPIATTIAYLSLDYDVYRWQLFCLELKKYLETESLSGGPYRRLEEIYSGILINCKDTLRYPEVLQEPEGIKVVHDFIKYMVNRKKIKFSYISTKYSLGMSIKEYIITISNMFIEWYNEEFRHGTYTYTFQDLTRYHILVPTIIKGNEFFTIGNYFPPNVPEKVYICTFKGEDIYLKLYEDLNIPNNSIILKFDISFYILTLLLKILNLNYGRKEINKRTLYL